MLTTNYTIRSATRRVAISPKSICYREMVLNNHEKTNSTNRI